MEPTESSDTSAYNNTLTPGTYPKEKKLQVLERLFSSCRNCGTLLYPNFVGDKRYSISVKCVFLFRLGKHSVGGAIVVNLWEGAGCVTLDRELRSRSPTLGPGGGGAT